MRELSSFIQKPEIPVGYVFMGCGRPCADIDVCNEGVKDCPDNETPQELLVCDTGYKMNEGECVLEGDCPAPVDDFTEWTDWTKAVCRKGQSKETRTRLCRAMVC